MVCITTDGSLRDSLGGLRETTELQDETGQTLAYVVPAHSILVPRPEDQCPSAPCGDGDVSIDHFPPASKVSS